MALPGLTGNINTRRGNRITAGGGPSDVNNFFGDVSTKLRRAQPDPFPTNNPIDPPKSPFNMNEPLISKRMDNLEDRLGNQDSHHRSLMEQLYKFQQDTKIELKRMEQALSEEKSLRQRSETIIKNQSNRISDLEEKVRLNESISRNNKNSLDQLLTHTKNIERGVNLSHQDIIIKKDSQEQRLSDLANKISNVESNRDSIEKMTYSAREETRTCFNKVEHLSSDVKDLKDSFQLLNKMFDTRDTNRSTPGGTISDTQKSIIESKILQLQNALMEIQSQVNKESKEREIDDHNIVSRLDELKVKIDNNMRRRDEELRTLRNALKSSPGMTESEKQGILIQLSSLETELRRMKDESSGPSASPVDLVNKIIKVEKDLSEEASTRRSNESSLLKKTEAKCTENRVHIEESLNDMRSIFQKETGDILKRLSSISSTTTDGGDKKTDEALERTIQKLEQRQSKLEADVENVDDKLRQGINSLQVDIGNKVLNNEFNQDKDSGQKAQNTNDFHKTLIYKISDMEKQIKTLRNEFQPKEDSIINQKSNDKKPSSSSILGDELMQKVHSISFNQGNIMRRVNSLENKIQEQEQLENDAIAEIRKVADSLQAEVDSKIQNLHANMDKNLSSRDTELQALRKSSKVPVSDSRSEDNKNNLLMKLTNLEVEVQMLAKERENKSASSLRNRISAIEKEVNAETHERRNADIRTYKKTETELDNLRVQMEDSLTEIRNITLDYHFMVQKRFQTFSEDQKRIKKELKSDRGHSWDADKINQRFNLMDARLKDIKGGGTGSKNELQGNHEEMYIVKKEIKEIKEAMNQRDEDFLGRLNEIPQTNNNISKEIGDKLERKMEHLNNLEGDMRIKMANMENNENINNNSRNDLRENDLPNQYLDESLKEIRRILLEYNLSNQQRFQTLSNDQSRLEERIEDLPSNKKISQRLKVMKRKINELNDRLRIGMNSLQVSLGDRLQALDEIKLESSNFTDAQGTRESLQSEINSLDEEVAKIKEDLTNINDQLKQSNSSKESRKNSGIMGDEWTQKVRMLVFNQDLMKRQITSVKEQVENCSPLEFKGLNDKVSEVEHELNQFEKDARRDMKDVREEINYLKTNESRRKNSLPDRNRPESATITDLQERVNKTEEQMNLNERYMTKLKLDTNEQFQSAKGAKQLLEKQIKDIEENEQNLNRFKRDTENELKDTKNELKDTKNNFQLLEKQVKDIEENEQNLNRFKRDTENELKDWKNDFQLLEKQVKDIEENEQNLNRFKRDTENELKDWKNDFNKFQSQIRTMDSDLRKTTSDVGEVKNDLEVENKTRKDEVDQINTDHQRLRGRVKRLKLRVRSIKDIVTNGQGGDSEDEDKGDI